MNLVLGIDPGLSGALAFYDMDTSLPVSIHDMPTFKSKNGKNQIDTFTLSNFVDSRAVHTRFAMIEEVHSMPNQSSVSTFTFGKVTGIVIGVAAAFMIPIYYIRPEVWKMSLGLSKNKDESRALASKMWPASVHLWPKKSHDGRAEALLLAYLGAKTYQRKK